VTVTRNPKLRLDAPRSIWAVWGVLAYARDCQFDAELEMKPRHANNGEMVLTQIFPNLIKRKTKKGK
jgi:hypothetical protein